MKFTSLLSALLVLSPLGLVAVDHGEPPVPSPYPDKLDTAAANKWWETAKAAREGKAGGRRHPPGTVTVSGRHFLDLEVPRDEVVAFALYTVQNKTLKMSAQLFPLFPDESRNVTLEIKQDGDWKQIAETKVNDLGWSALFRIEDWDDSRDVSYRVRHGDKAMFEGLVRKAPLDKETLVVASLSCNSSGDRGGRPNYIRNIKAVDPDMLFFAGDQHYDHTEHTAGWLMFGLQFREVLKDRPVITIPDDHDVGQHNLWGEGGKKATSPAGDTGGYFYDPEYVKQVERCQTAHLPDPVDPAPIGQGIGVYFTRYKLGQVDFAIIEDRKFKSGPGGKIENPYSRVDHVRDPSFDTSTFDKPGLILLGDRQLAFLNAWSEQWDGVQLKAVLSQTPFCGAAHLHGGSDVEKNRLIADLDSNGWPQTGRNKALRAMRKGFAIHLSGDQHLATMLQHGIDEYDDGPWSLVSPAIVNTIYGRYWHPANEQPGAEHDPDSPLPWTGRYLDGLQNKITMHAYANPAKEYKGSAGGMVVARFDTTKRTITAECWPRYADLTKPDAAQFPGWPRVIPQVSNYSPPSWEVLGQFSSNVNNPVVQLIDEESKDVLYTLRLNGKSAVLKGPVGRKFTVKAGQESADKTVAENVSTAQTGKYHITL